MQAPKLFVLCTALLVGASPITVKPTTASPISLSPRIPTLNLTTPTSNTTLTPHDWHGQPYCTPTGPGFCNFAFYWFHGPDGQQFDSLFVYDRSCNVIGSQTGVDMLEFEVDSQLPYVVVGQFNGLFKLQLNFEYAGRSYGDNCYQYCGSSTCTSFVKQCAFQC